MSRWQKIVKLYEPFPFVLLLVVGVVGTLGMYLVGLLGGMTALVIILSVGIIAVLMLVVVYCRRDGRFTPAGDFIIEPFPTSLRDDWPEGSDEFTDEAFMDNLIANIPGFRR